MTGWLYATDVFAGRWAEIQKRDAHLDEFTRARACRSIALPLSKFQFLKFRRTVSSTPQPLDVSARRTD